MDHEPAGRHDFVLIGVMAAGIGAVTLFFYFDLHRFFTLSALKANRLALLDFRDAHPLAMVGAFMAVYVVTTALSLPGAAILSLAAGAIFGPWMGTVCACTAATAGATLAFLATRHLLRDVVSARFGRRLDGINREFERRGASYLLFLRLVPVFPFFLVNLAAGLTRLPLRTFVSATMIGIVPGGFVYVNAGATLATLTSISDVASPAVLGSFALLGLFVLVPALVAKSRG